MGHKVLLIAIELEYDIRFQVVSRKYDPLNLVPSLREGLDDSLDLLGLQSFHESLKLTQ